MITRRQLLVLITLLFYWPAIFVGTHIRQFPQWTSQVPMSDKTMHYIAYFLLMFLLWYSIDPNHKVNWRKPAGWLVLLSAVLYGVIDEWLQMYVGRCTDVRDFIADMAGAITALVLLTIFHFWPACLILTGSMIFIMNNFMHAHSSNFLSAIETGFSFIGYAFFSLLWLRYIHHFTSVKSPQIRWLIGAALLPMGLVLASEVFCVITGNGFKPHTIIASLAGIALVVAFMFIYGLITSIRQPQEN